MERKPTLATWLRVRYFETEGKHNLALVIDTLRVALRKREGLRSRKLIFFSAEGQGPALAYNRLREFHPDIIAVTFPPGFTVKIKNEEGADLEKPVAISEELTGFFRGVGIRVLTGRLPFDEIASADHIDRGRELIKDVLSLFGGGFSLCIQAVLQACDMGAVEIGEQVIAVSGDCAALVTASTTEKFLSPREGLAINEILCKPRNLSLTRKPPAKKVERVSGELFVDKVPKLLPPVG